MRGRGRGEGGHVREPVVEPAGHVHAVCERARQHLEPRAREHAAAVGHAYDQGPRAPRRGCGDGDVLDAEIGVTVVQAKLAEAPVGTPVGDALRGLGGERVPGIAEEQQKRRLDIHGGLPPRPSERPAW